MSDSRPNLIVDGKLDHTATTAELRRCIDTLLRKARFELAYDIRATGPASAAYVSPDAGGPSGGSRSSERRARAHTFNASNLRRGLTTCRDSSSHRYA